MNRLIKKHWLILEDGREMTREDRDLDFFANGQKPIKVIGHKWMLDDANKTFVIKKFNNPKNGVGGDLLADGTGIIMTEPPEIVGERFVVVYNADGSERFRLDPHIDLAKFPTYLKDAWLVGYQFFTGKPYAHFYREMGERVLEFDLETGAYTGTHWEVR